MAEPIHDLNTLFEGLKQQRDTLKLQLSLGRAEVRDEWQELETKLEQLRGKARQVGREAQATSREVGEAAKLIAEELQRGYERIRRLL